jgi:putative lipoic acid-binding regulatory protein
MTEKDCKPKIDYPCPWAYKVIGRDLESLTLAIAEVIGETPHTVTPSHTSRSGAYHCLNVAVTVDSEALRLGLYDRLRRHPAVLMVM